MEDDDSDISMTIDESVSTEKTTASHLASVDKNSEVVSVLVSSPKLLETDNIVTKSDNEDINKPVSIQGKGLPPNSENSIALVISESDVPKSPKKVNGEVRSLECETGEQQSDAEISVKSAAAKRARLSDEEVEDRNTNFDKDKTKSSSKYKQISGIKEVKEGSQNIENNTEYKGFKKKIIAQTSIASNNVSDSVAIAGGASRGSSKSVKFRKTSKNSFSSESQHVLVSHQPLPDGTQSSAQLTEYAQYLGLQPTVKFKCYNCSESGFPTMLKLHEHQNICLKSVNKMQPLVKPTPPPTLSEPNPSTNFRITRKVYLCSGCGTYYENWNLFLHMREVHKRHICLFCLGMFSQADKLASHLSVKHGVLEASYNSEDHFVGENKGSFFVMCCTCERIFSERENFYDHSCSEGLIINAEKACSLCGLRGAHFPTCRRAFTDSNTSPPSSSAIPGPIENPSEPIQNSQHGIQERNATVTKYLIPVTKPPCKKANKGNTVQESLGDSQEKPRELSDIEDDYDISNAASFCHVNIHEPQEKQKAVSATKSKTIKGKNVDGAGKKTVIEAKPTESSPTTTKQSENIEKSAESSEEKDEPKRNTNITTEKNSEESEKMVEEEKEVEEEEKQEKNDTEVQTDNEKQRHNLEPEVETEKMDVDDQIDTEKCSSPEVPPKAETEVGLPPESETKTESEERAAPEESKPAETNETPVPKTEESPKLLPESETKLASKTQTATEAESESESSDSGDESDSSSSSEASSEESDRHDEEKTEDKMEESDADNADSDKMSLIVDENRSDEETELQPKKPNQGEEEDEGEEDEEEEEEEEKDEAELKINEDEIVKEDVGEEEEEKSDAEMVDNVDLVDDAEENKSVDEEKAEEHGESIQLAGDDVPLLELTLEENLDTMNIQLLLKESVKVSCLNCVYCNHAKKIAVNGKQLALHLLAEHRFAPVVCSDSGELTEADGFVEKLKSSLSELQLMFFNTDSYDNMDQSCMRPYDRTYECFHCHFLTTLHKELYVHNRKMHQKTILLCIMCKSNFYSYSELLCHMCPGIYVPESNINFRCCLCTVDGLPSAFRLMVHLRKRHHACDVCLETNGDQQKLSNHVWKHKLHHLCYRCGIAYRNKPDITKHLFWKHGTESVLCKKCLQKKWPHVYHFCIPPNAFVCEECNSSFSRAVALKVHKRLHAGDLPYQCDECEERFISRKLLLKHQKKHSEPPIEVVEGNMQENGPSGEIESHEDDEEDEKLNTENESRQEVEKDVPELEAINSGLAKGGDQEHTKDPGLMHPTTEVKDEAVMDTSVAENSAEGPTHEEKDTSEKKSKVLDVYDLPPLNLSSDSDESDEDGEVKVGAKSVKPANVKSVVSGNGEKLNPEEKVTENVPLQEEQDETQQPIQVVDGIWENFKTYKANLEKRVSKPSEAEDNTNKKMDTVEPSCSSKCPEEMISIIHMDHDYCSPPAGSSQSAAKEEIPESMTCLQDEPAHHKLSSLPDALKTEETKEKTDDELKAHDADHNYCYTNTSLSVEEEKEKESTSEHPASVVSSSKKKQKSPKKKQKRSASSSSSDSSSNSDSTSCSCGTNCSCSSSSSSSSGSSSSQSSDSDSSSSEGRRRQAARRERRRERAKKRKAEETEELVQPPPPPQQQPSTPPQSPKVEPVVTAANGPPGQEEVSAIPSLVEPEDVELPVRESDLDTDETETDEDFYDKYPQKLANKLLAEKRNQLLLLAAVAPVNNGTMSQSCQSPPTSSVEEPVPKKKLKTKKHRKSQHQHITTENKVENKLKLNIPTDYYSSQTPAYSKATVSSSSTNNSINTTSLATPTRTVQSPFLSSHPESSTPTTAYQSTGSGSETESKRLSKRKRVPKRFYGDSSDEEHEQHPPVKWRKVSAASSNSPAPQAQSVPPFSYKSTPISIPEQFHNPSNPVPVNEDKSEEDEDEDEEEAPDDSDSDREDTKKTSSESSNSESEGEKEQDDDLSDADSETDAPLTVQTNTVSAAREGDTSLQQKNENLYCYCQCPYDEVSEMIACDGKDCTIEWFHFECVGIMVPPKGKWYCPDCRKKSAVKSDHSSSNM